MQDQEPQSSTEARGALPPGLSPGLAAALADPTGQTSERLASDNRVAVVVSAVNNTLAQLAEHVPGLTGEEVVEALARCTGGVLRDRSRTPMQP